MHTSIGGVEVMHTLKWCSLWLTFALRLSPCRHPAAGTRDTHPELYPYAKCLFPTSIAGEMQPAQRGETLPVPVSALCGP